MLVNFVRNVLLAVEKRARPVFSRPDAWLRAVAVSVNAILVIALAHALAGLTAAILWSRLPLPVKAVTSALPDPFSSEIAIAQPTDYAAISAWHLFGRMEAPQTVEAPPAPMPTTPLNLRLAGVFFVERGGDRALALIAEGNGMERGYRIGESLPGGARLDQIQRDSVVVSRGGRREVLNLPRLEDAGKMPVSEDMAPAMPAEPAMPMPMPMPAEPGMMPEPATFHEPRPIDATAVAARLRGAVSNRPQGLEDIAFASPYVQNGQFLGFRLRPGRDRQLMQQLGLNSGDVITEVNGSRLNNPMQGLAVLQELLHAERVSVRVLRNGAEIPLAFSLGGPAVE
jgi:general secretion pathway protein C